MPLTIEHEGKEITVYTKEELDSEVAGLKVTNQQLKDEKKAAADAKAAAEEAARVAAEEKAKAEGDHAKLLELQEQRQAEAAEKFNKLMGTVKTEKIANTLNGIVNQFGAGGQKNEDLRDLLKSRYNFDYDSETGQVTVAGDGVASLDDLQAAIKTSGRYDSFIAGSNANGGGSSSNGGSGGTTGKSISRADFDAMDQGKRSEFFKSGGKVTDD